MFTLLGVALTSLFWSPNFELSRKLKNKLMGYSDYILHESTIDHAVEERGDEVQEKLEVETDLQCVWMTVEKDGEWSVPAAYGPSVKLDSHATGCAVTTETVCYLITPGANHSKVGCKDDCRVYQRTIELLGE